MKSGHLKLAGVVTIVCGSMSSFDTWAAVNDSPTIATGSITPMQDEPQEVAQSTDDEVQPQQNVTAAEPQNTPDVMQSDAEDVVTPARESSADAAVVVTPARESRADAADVVTPARESRADAADVVTSARESGADAAVVVTPVRESSADAANVVTPARESSADAADTAWASPDLVAVSENRLDDMRGGFDLPSGLVVSFGVSRAAFVNGNLVAQTSFNIPDIANMTAQQAQMLASANTGALLQVGTHNSVQQGALPALTGSVIQNSLSDQQIQALTTINAGVNSLGAFKAMNFLSTMNTALAGAVRPH